MDLIEAKGRELLKAFDYFYYINGRFLLDNNLVTVPKPKTTSFIETDDEISLIALHERLRGGKSHTLSCTKFLCPLNVQLGGDDELEISRSNKLILL